MASHVDVSCAFAPPANMVMAAKTAIPADSRAMNVFGIVFPPCKLSLSDLTRYE